ncbi:MAG: radical SAM protein [Candidatus Thorarchaeota archaeon]
MQEFKNSKLPLIIFGAGVVGEEVLRVCDEEGLKVACFCDDNKDKKNIKDKAVIHTSKIKDFYPNANFIITSADIKDVKLKLLSLEYAESNLYSCIAFLDYKKFKKGYISYAIEAALRCQKEFEKSSQIFLRSIDIVVTERCNLRCKDCSNLMQFFSKPLDYGINDLKVAIRLLSSKVDIIQEARVIGGEPFINKDLHLILKILVETPNIEKVVIYTNGIIPPKPFQVEYLKHSKIVFMITDYTGYLNKYKKNLDNLEDLCKKENITYRRSPPENWVYCSEIKYHNRTEKDLCDLFQECCAKNLFTLSKNEVHRCPFSAHITRLGICNFEEDYLNLNNKNLDFLSFIHGKNYLQACNYCSGRRLSDDKIIPAIQSKKVLPIDV